MIKSPLTHDHGTPLEYVQLMHAVYERTPDLDPASDEKWNRVIQAKRIITEADDAMVAPWFAGAPLPNRLLTDRRVLGEDLEGELLTCNPPNDASGALAAFFWKTCVEYFMRGYARSVFFVGFNVEQIARFQRIGARTSPLRRPTIVPGVRPRYLDGETLQPQKAPMHASFITLLSREPRQIQTFTALGKELGDVVNGY